MKTQGEKIAEMLENNKRIIAENNLKTWEEIHAYTLATRLENKSV